jgi:tRNA dimethylallyltransferase
MERRLVAIVGPTASGKSDIALELAERLGGEIVNADSRQIYRGMDIGTAKPTPEDRRRVRHHLYDIVDPTEDYSLGRFKHDAREALERIWSRGSFAWLAGGTGQYVWALLEDWSVPEVPPDRALREELNAFAEEHGEEALHARLAAVDPDAASLIDRRNVRRVIRALEVYEHTGQPISAQQTKGTPDFQYLLFGISLPKEDLVYRINRRAEWMFEHGLVEETQALLDADVPADASSISSIGYAQAVRYLRGETNRRKAVEDTKQATRQLARRQRQWFREADRRITWVRAESAVDSIDMQANIFTGACVTTVKGERSGQR